MRGRRLGLGRVRRERLRRTRAACYATLATAGAAVVRRCAVGIIASAITASASATRAREFEARGYDREFVVFDIILNPEDFSVNKKQARIVHIRCNESVCRLHGRIQKS